jgi:hypothetical protein
MNICVCEVLVDHVKLLVKDEGCEGIAVDNDALPSFAPIEQPFSASLSDSKSIGSFQRKRDIMLITRLQSKLNWKHCVEIICLTHDQQTCA